MRVALLHPTYWPEVRRGSERFARELADGLLERGHAVRLITSHPGMPSRRVEDGLEVVRTWRPPQGRLRRRGYEPHLLHAPAAWWALRRGREDVAHALHPVDAVAAVRCRRAGGGPVVLSYMGIPHRRGLANRRWRLRLTLEAMERADAVVALSAVAARAFERWLGVQPRVIPPPVDLTTFSPGGSRHPEPTIVCAADASEPRKRVDLLVEAFAAVRRRRPTARLVLDRPGDPGLAAALARPGVELADLDDRAALAGAYRSAWVSALTSYGEAFGLVLAEALACGTPVVGARDGGAAEIVGDRPVGRLFDGDDPEAVAEALLGALELAEDPATAGACRERAEAFSAQACAQAYEALYAELLGR